MRYILLTQQHRKPIKGSDMRDWLGGVPKDLMIRLLVEANQLLQRDFGLELISLRGRPEDAPSGVQQTLLSPALKYAYGCGDWVGGATCSLYPRRHRGKDGSLRWSTFS